MTVTRLAGDVLVGPIDAPPFTSVLDAVHEIAATTPQRVAVRDVEHTLTYAELVAESHRYGRLLREAGVVPGERVVTMLTRSTRWPAVVLAIWSVDAVYVPVPGRIDDRVRDMLVEVDARVILSDVDVEAVGEVTGGSSLPPVVRIDQVPPVPTDGDGPAVDETAGRVADASGDHPAYVLFTSGSTGRPKGVQVGHHALASFCWAFGRVTGVTPDTVALGYSDASFDVSLLDLFVPLSHGARVAIMSGGARQDPALVQQWCQSERVTWGFLPVSLLGLVEPDGLPDWRTVIAGAEAPSPRLVRRWTRQHDRIFFNCYGPTEGTVTCCAHRVPAGTDGAGEDGRVPIGRPLPNHQIMVLGPDGPCAAGDVGELCVAGAGLADGYLAGGRLHAGDGAFTTLAGERYYRTGDQARVGEDGNLIFLGRLDRQVKLRGQRVELGEIDTRIERHPQVTQATSRVLDLARGQALVVFYRGAVKPPELIAWTAEHLPPAMQPARWVPVQAFPLTTSGKIDETALAALVAQPLAPRSGGLPADGEVEPLVRQVWEEFLGAAEAGRGFYASGGDSVVAMQLAAALREQHNVQVPVASVLTARDMTDLAHSIERGRLQTPHLAAHGDVPETRGKALPSGGAPLTPAGQRLWLGWNIAPTSTANHIQVVRRIRGPLDPARLAQALTELPARHTVLDCRVEPATGRLVPSSVPLDVRVVERPTVGSEVLRAILDEELSVPFDLLGGPLWRALLVGDVDDHVLVLTFHHLVFDGWSLAPVLAAIADGYAGLAPVPEWGWAGYSSRRQALQVSRGAQDRQWWRDHLAGAATMLPVLLPSEGPPKGIGRRSRQGLPDDLLKAGRELAHAVGASPAAIHLAAFAETLGLLTGVKEVLIGVPIAEREGVESVGAVGMFTEIVPTRHRLGPELTFRELCDHAARELTEATAHAGVGLQAIAQAAGVERHPDRPAVVQVLFNAYNFDSEAGLGLVGTTDLPLDPAVPATDFDLTLYTLTVDGKPSLEALTDAAVDSQAVQSLLVGLVERWTALIAAPDAALADLTVPPALAEVASRAVGGLGVVTARHTRPASAGSATAAKVVGRPGPRVPPRPGVEEDIAQVWAEVLGIPTPGATDNFFDVGGHSMAIAQVHERLVHRGLSINLIDLFAHPTVRALAQHCSRESREVTAESTMARAGANRGAARRAAAARRRRPATGSSRRDTP